MKLFTTASALEIFGQNFTFETKIFHDGEIDKEGVLNGNIYIKGGGDPCLGSKQFYEEYYKSYFLQNWVEAIKKKGIKKIKGSIIADARIYKSGLVPKTWCWEDIGNYYGAAYSGLSIYDNTFAINLKNINKKTEIESIYPDLPSQIHFINRVKILNKPKNNINIFRGSYQNKIYIRGYMSSKKIKVTVKGAIPDPALWASFALHKKLIENSIDITDGYSKVPDDNDYKIQNLKFLTKTTSPKLKDIISLLNKKSINQYS